MVIKLLLDVVAPKIPPTALPSHTKSTLKGFSQGQMFVRLGCLGLELTKGQLCNTQIVSAGQQCPAKSHSVTSLTEKIHTGRTPQNMVTRASLFGLEALEGNMNTPGEKPPPWLHPIPPFTWWMVSKHQAFSSLGGTHKTKCVCVKYTVNTS